MRLIEAAQNKAPRLGAPLDDLKNDLAIAYLRSPNCVTGKSGYIP